MPIREANKADIKRIQVVRHLVKENILSDPSLVTDDDCEDYINRRGKGWVSEEDGAIVGFAIADLQDKSIWALFIQPEYEGRGIGRQLHDTMMDWYFSKTTDTVWLSTSPHTRAETFYRKAGWKEAGMKNGEMVFEFTADDWSRLHN